MRARLIVVLCLYTGLAACAGESPFKGMGIKPKDATVSTSEVAESGPTISARAASVLRGTAFGQSIAEAVQSHPQTGISDATIGRAEAEYKAAVGAFRPSLSIGLDLESRYSSATTNTTSGLNPFVRVSQLIYDGGAARRQKAASEAGIALSQDQRLLDLASTTMLAVETYIDVISTAAVLELSEQNLAAHRRILRQIEERRAFGAGSESDVLTIRSRTSDAQTNAVNARAELDRAHARYAEIFGSSPSGTLATPPPAPAPTYTAGNAIAESARMRTLDGRIVYAEERLAAVKAQRMPRLELGGTGVRGRDGGADFVLGMTVEYAFDTRRQSSAAIETAQAELDALRSERGLLERDIQRALDFLISDQNASAQRLSVAEQAVRANLANVNAAKEEFSIGRRTLIEVLDAQRDYINARQRVIDAKRSRLLNGYQALALTGDIVSAFGIVDRPTVGDP